MSSEISSVKRSRRDRALFRKAMLLMAVAPIAGLAEHVRAAAVFTDTFPSGNSTVNGTSTPAASKTSYDIASSKNQAPNASISSAGLKFGLAASTSAIEETQAIFTLSPVTLATAGDSMDFVVTFDAAGVLTTGTTSTLDFGLFDSGSPSSLPYAGTLANSGLASGTTSSATGGTQNWLGYLSSIALTGGTSKIATRPAQSGTSNTNQDLIGDGASASSTYGNPAGSTLASGSTGQTATLTNGTQYTEDMNITLASAGTYDITSSLYTGTAVSGTPIATETTGATVTGTNFFNGFDGLAIGYRETGNITSSMTVTFVQISDLIQTGSSSNLSISLSGTAPAALNQNLIATLSINGANGNYIPVTTAVTGPAQTTGYVAVNGFNPVNDAEIYCLDAAGGTSLSQLIADLQTALNTSDPGAIAEVPTGSAAGLLTAAGDNVELVFPTGPGTAPAYLAYDLSGYTSNGTWTISSITVVPEPTSIGLLGLGAIGMLRRRKAHRKATSLA